MAVPVSQLRESIFPPSPIVVLIIPRNHVVGVAVAMVIKQVLLTDSIIFQKSRAPYDNIWTMTSKVSEVDSVSAVVWGISILKL